MSVQNVERHYWLRLLASQNPFYVISAVFVLYGLRQCFSGESGITEGWTLMGLLCGYTLLLAGAAWLIVRFGQVWDDARTVLLLLVLLFLAVSVSFDERLLANPAEGMGFLWLGFAFSIVVSETMIRSLGMRLTALYRAAYYLILAAMFFYPAALAVLSVAGENLLLAWGVYLFPWLSASLLLMLWPAARRGATVKQPNGTPWRWPLYPWSLFAFLAVCLGLRSYSLSVTFEAAGGVHAVFAPHFLMPLLLACCVLLLELAISTGNTDLRRFALLAPLGLLLLAFPGSTSHQQHRFLELLCESLASPAQLTAWALVAFYGVWSLRGQRLAEWGLTVAVLFAGCVGPHSVTVAGLALASPWPLDLLAVLHVAIAFRHGQTSRGLVGCGLVGAALGVRIMHSAALVPTGYLALHAASLMALVVVVACDDALARRLRRAAPCAFGILAATAALVYPYVFRGLVPEVWHALYLAALTMLAAAYWLRVTNTPQLISAAATCTALLFSVSRYAWRNGDGTVFDRGLHWLVLGLVFLALAVVFSLHKGGVVTRTSWQHLKQTVDRLHRFVRQRIPWSESL